MLEAAEVPPSPEAAEVATPSAEPGAGGGEGGGGKVNLYTADYDWEEHSAEHTGILELPCTRLTTEEEAAVQREQGECWERHHYAHRCRSFSAKNYLAAAFPELEGGSKTVVDAGCGAGASTLPLLKAFPSHRFVCFDLSVSAVARLRADPAFAAASPRATAVA
eukprot:Hpha_TRINITY_DN20585_c0_g1::TRINITY_DN20585_c0_g1_i1::g.30734::m.30734